MTLAILLPLLLGPRPPGPVPLVALLCALARLTMTLWHQLPDRPSQLRAAAVFTAAIDLETLVRGRAAIPARLDLALPLPLALDALDYLTAAIDPLAARWPARVLDWPRCRSEVESLQRYLQAQARPRREQAVS